MNYIVVANAGGQYAVRAADGPPLPSGWREAGVRGTEEECLDHVARTWTDVVPDPDPSGSASGSEPGHGSGSADGRFLPAVLREVARRTPLAPALRWRDGGHVSHGELDAASDRLATRLAGAGVRRGDVIPVRLPRSPGLVTALIAVLKLGAAYVAVPADWPVTRLEQLVRVCRSPVAVDDEANPTQWTCPSVDLTAAMPDVGAYAPAAPVEIDGGDPACVFFTSGSTGEPKGAVCPHRALTGLLTDPDFADYRDGVVTLQAAALPWDAFALELFGALLNGGCCVLPDGGPLGPLELRAAVEESGVNTLFLTTSLFNMLLDVDPGCLSGLRQVMTGGEKVSVPHFRRFRELHPRTRLIHAYGPVEATVFTTTHTVTDADVADEATDIPIGIPVRGAGLHVLDSAGSPVGAGETGELYVSGIGLCHGYLGNSRETARRFVPVPVPGRPGSRAYRTGDLVRMAPDGVLSYVARADRQVKLRGVRIEPGEVESALRTCGGVLEAAVVPVRDAAGRVIALHGWYTGRGAMNSSAIRAELGGKLPAACVPATLGRLETLPRGHSGKIDTRALETLAGTAVTVPPVTRELVIRLLSEVLGRPMQDSDAEFVHLGGSSLSATTLAVRLARLTGRRIGAADILANGTAGGIAEYLEQAPLSVPPTAAASPAPLPPVEHPDSAARLFRVTGVVDQEALGLALDDVVKQHPVLSQGRGAVLSVAPAVGAPEELLDRQHAAGPGPGDPTVRIVLAPVAEAEDTGGGEWALAVSVRRALVDEWSVRILLEDLGSSYRARLAGGRAELEPEERPFQEWRGGALQEAAPGGLTGIAWPSPSSQAHGAPGGREARVVNVPAHVRTYARTEGVTFTAVLLAATAAALRSVTGADDLLVAVPVSGRDAPGLERTIGPVARFLPVRLGPASGPRGAQEALLTAMRAGAAAGGSTAQSLPQPCQVAVVHHLRPVENLALHGTKVRPVQPEPDGTGYQMALDVRPRPGGAWSVSLVTDRSVVSGGTAAALHAALEAELSAPVSR
ncbi:amino acid adenylation domain-containing protein [Streptomyces sp. NPDC001594]|uniref:amino acid adenylation domain-containing protein n=1 Tax=Streptomyces sp. NPDC001594 TaxID=3364590 RepID=UPI0036B8BD0D